MHISFSKKMLIILRLSTKHANFGAFGGRRCSTPLIWWIPASLWFVYPAVQQAIILYISLVFVLIYIAGIVEINPGILDIQIYFKIRNSFAHLRPMILSADWSIRGLQSWTCSRLPTVAEFAKLTQSIVIDIPRQSADLYKVQLCNERHFSIDF